MKLSRGLAFIDLECSDADPTTCAIFEYAAVVLMPDGTRKGGSIRFKPWKPILPEVEKLTGVTNEMVANCPPFSEYAERIYNYLQDKDLAGYNLARFDIVCLDEELRRCGFRLDLAGVAVVDAYGIFSKKSPRKLVDAVRTYVGTAEAEEFAAQAHGAKADAEASLAVLLGQLAVYEDLAALSLEDLAKFSRHGEFDYIDIAGKLYRDAEGDMCFAFGTHRGAKVKTRLPYCDWILGPKASFPGSTVEKLTEELRRLGL